MMRGFIWSLAEQVNLVPARDCAKFNLKPEPFINATHSTWYSGGVKENRKMGQGFAASLWFLA